MQGNYDDARVAVAKLFRLILLKVKQIDDDDDDDNERERGTVAELSTLIPLKELLQGDDEDKRLQNSRIC